MTKVLALVLVALMVLSFAYAGNALAADVISISEARTKPTGTSVTVKGIVTVKPGTFDKGFAIQDESGGIYVYPQSKLSFELGDEVQVTGKIDNYNGLIEVKPASSSDVKLLGHKSPVDPKHFKTGEIGAKTNGLLVEVTGKVVAKKDYYFYVDDGSGKCEIFKKKRVDFDMSSIKLGEKLTIVGFSSQYQSYYEILPRGQEDIKKAAAVTKPGAPENLSAGITESLSVMLKWNPPADNGGADITEYKIYKGTESGKEEFLKSVNDMQFEDKKVEEGKTYYYYVAAVNSAGEGEKSEEVSITVSLILYPPANLKAEVKGGKVVLTWDQPKKGQKEITGFAIYRGIESGAEPDVPIAVVDADKTTYTDSSVEAGNTYYYVVKAFDNENPPDYSAPSNEVSAWVGKPENFVGSWINKNSETDGITKVNIRIAEGKIFVHAWGKCHPTDCDWGEESTDVSDADDGILNVKWVFDFAINKLEISISKGETLKIVSFTHYTDNSGRIDFSETYYFKRVDSSPPNLMITSPSNYSIVDTNSVTVSGKAIDESGIDKVTVNGSEVSVSSNGSFSKTVNLLEGTNTITLVATDKVGNKTTKTITVIYKSQIVITLKPDNPMMTVNGEATEIDPGRGTKPVIIAKWGRTVVPIRAIVEALGGTIEWDGTERKVTINFNETTIELWIDNPKAKVNGETKWIDENDHDVKPIIVNGRTMLPLRFVAESLGCNVDWDPVTKTITITYTP